MRGIYNNLWIQDDAESAVALYTSLFEDSSVGDKLLYNEAGQEIHGQEPGTAMTINFTLAGREFIALRGGGDIRMDPSISLAVSCPSREEVDRMWEALSDGGKTIMELGEHEWSPHYGWVEDRYGLSWQLSFAGDDASAEKTVVPCFLFHGENYRRAREAMELWTSVFDDSGIEQVVNREEDPEAVLWAQFKLDGETYSIMESPLEHDFEFNYGYSLLVDCETQEEIDHYWDALIEGGQPDPCGWLRDKFGVSWQIAPAVLPEMLRDGTHEQAVRVTDCFMAVHGKLNIADLEAAYAGTA